MRLFLLPISTHRALLYCQRLDAVRAEQQNWLDKGIARAAQLWASWEKKESGWQKKVVDYGNQALKRIPYQEWGLKSIPPLARRTAEELSALEPVELSFPPTLIPPAGVEELLRKLGTERQRLHRMRMIYSLIGMPISAPVALIPFVPNLPFFYLVFRAWSHWRALSGSRHIQFLLDKKLIKPQPSSLLDKLYSSGLQFDSLSVDTTRSTTHGPLEYIEKMLLSNLQINRIAHALHIPELEIELDRATWQVERAIKDKVKKDEKNEKLKQRLRKY